MLNRIPPAAAQILVIAGLAVCTLGVALPYLRSAAGAGARSELEESEAYLEARVAQFARDNDLSPNHSMAVSNYRSRLTDELEIPALRRAVATHSGSERRTPAAPLLVFAGLAALGLGCLVMVATARGGQAVWLAPLGLVLAAGGVALPGPDAEVPAMTMPAVGDDGPAPAPVSDRVSDRRLCEHLLDILFTGDQANLRDQIKDQFMPSCQDALSKKPPTAAQRRCVMQARSQKDFERCGLSD